MAIAEREIPGRAEQTPPVIKTARDLVGTFRDPVQINARLAWARNNCNLVSPQNSIVFVPEGFAICITIVPLGERDYYPLDPTEREYCLNRQGSKRIGSEAQVEWNAGLTRRLDNGKNSRYSQFVVGGAYRAWDTTKVSIGATRHLNLIDGSEKIQEIYDQADGDTRRAERFIRRMRAFIHEYVESMARTRAMQDCGVQVSYTREEIARPFVVAKMQWTAQSDDAQLQREFQLLQAKAALGASLLLFGEQPTQTPGAPAQNALPAPAASAPAPASEAQLVLPSAAATNSTSTPAPKQRRRKSRAVVVDAIHVPFDQPDGTPIVEAPEEELARLESECLEGLTQPTGPSKTELKRRLTAIRQVRKVRRVSVRPKSSPRNGAPVVAER